MNKSLHAPASSVPNGTPSFRSVMAAPIMKIAALVALSTAAGASPAQAEELKAGCANITNTGTVNVNCNKDGTPVRTGGLGASAVRRMIDGKLVPINGEIEKLHEEDARLQGEIDGLKKPAEAQKGVTPASVVVNVAPPQITVNVPGSQGSRDVRSAEPSLPKLSEKTPPWSVGLMVGPQVSGIHTGVGGEAGATFMRNFGRVAAGFGIRVGATTRDVAVLGGMTPTDVIPSDAVTANPEAVIKFMTSRYAGLMVQLSSGVMWDAQVQEVSAPDGTTMRGQVTKAYSKTRIGAFWQIPLFDKFGKKPDSSVFFGPELSITAGRPDAIGQERGTTGVAGGFMLGVNLGSLSPADQMKNDTIDESADREEARRERELQERK